MSYAAETMPWRRLIYPLLITVAAAAVGGRILSVARLWEPYLFRAADDPADIRGRWPSTRPEPTPTLGENDRSRWDTIRALVDQGTYVIGHRDVDAKTGQYQDRGIISEDGWRTIDKVLDPKTHDFYSSKPPLLATLVAAEYRLLKQAFGWSIVDQRWPVVRIILLTVNWLPVVIYLLLLARLVDRLGVTDWGRLFVVTAGCFATFLTPFAITLNNHTVATCSALFGLYPALHIWSELSKAQGVPGFVPGIRPWHFVLAGFFAAFTAANELPATSFAVGLFLLLLWRAPQQTLMFFLPAAAIPVAAFFWTNYQAVHEWTPVYGKLGSEWYQYPGSHWQPPEPGKEHGIDWAGLKETKTDYAFHLLLGHHGFFSLTPIFLLAVLGMVLDQLLRVPIRSREPTAWTEEYGLPIHDPALKLVGSVTLILTLVVAGFYIARTSNYGGWTSGPRWLMWLTPFWLLTLLPVADWLSFRRWGRGLAYLTLAVSVLSVSYPAWNPWRHPWLYDLLSSLGRIPY